MPPLPPLIVQLWTEYSIAVTFTAFRTFARIKAVGFRELQPDDFLIWVAILIYTAQCTLGYNLGLLAHGMDNSNLSDAARASLQHDDPEYGMRLIGAKIQVAGWTSAVCLLWTLKMCVAFFYLRLTNGLDRYPMRIYIAMSIILATFVGNIFTIFLSCRPFNHYWQINPNPGNVCQAAISKPIVWASFVSNVLTDVMLLIIPLPMLWKSKLRLAKKIATTFVLCAGVVIIACAILKSVYVIVDPVEGGLLAAQWGTRETFIAVITTNLPMIFPLLKTYLGPFIPAALRTASRRSRPSNAYNKTPENGFVTIGGTGGSRSDKGKSSYGGSRFSTSAMRTYDTENKSDEHIMHDMEMQDMAREGGDPRDIVVEKKVHVFSQERENSEERTVKEQL